MDKALIITSDFFPQKEIIINTEDYKKLEMSNIFILFKTLEFKNG